MRSNADLENELSSVYNELSPNNNEMSVHNFYDIGAFNDNGASNLCLNFIQECNDDVNIEDVSSDIVPEILMSHSLENSTLCNEIEEDNNMNECNNSPNQTRPNSDSPDDPYMQLTKFSKSHSKKMIFSHLNINSLSSKFVEIFEILQKSHTDIFFISETKIDDSFPSAQFHVPSFTIHRLDRNSHGGR